MSEHISSSTLQIYPFRYKLPAGGKKPFTLGLPPFVKIHQSNACRDQTKSHLCSSSCYCSKKTDIPWQLGRMIWNHHCNQSPKHEIPRHLFAKQISQNNSGFWKAHTCHAGVIWKSTCFSLPSSKCLNPSNRLQDLLIFRFSFCFIIGLCFSFPPVLASIPRASHALTYICMGALFSLENLPKYSCVCARDIFWGITSRMTNPRWPQQ